MARRPHEDPAPRGSETPAPPAVRLGVAAAVPRPLVAALVADLACLPGGVTCAAVAVDAPGLDAVLHPGPVPEGAEGMVLLRDPWVLLVPSAWPLADARTAVSAGDLARLRYVDGPTGLAQPLVAAGLGAAIVPRAELDEGDARTVALALDHLRAPATYRLSWPVGRDRTPAVRVLREAARATCARIDGRRELLAALTGGAAG